MEKAISWVGTAASIAGSFTLALKFALLGYSFFLIGAASWLIVGLRKRDGALVALNSAFMLANLIGIYNA